MAEIKTAEQIAEDAARKVLSEHAGIQEFVGSSAGIDALAWDLVDASGSLIVEHALTELVRYAIEADRALREVQAAGRDYRNGFDNTVAAALYDCLTDRETEEAARAAEWVAENENGELWDRFIGPMLDEMEKEYGR